MFCVLCQQSKLLLTLLVVVQARTLHRHRGSSQFMLPVNDSFHNNLVQFLLLWLDIASVPSVSYTEPPRSHKFVCSPQQYSLFWFAWAAVLIYNIVNICASTPGEILWASPPSVPPSFLLKSEFKVSVFEACWSTSLLINKIPALLLLLKGYCSVCLGIVMVFAVDCTFSASVLHAYYVSVIFRWSENKRGPHVPSEPYSQ